MLAAAQTFGDFRNIADTMVAARAWAKAHGLGIEAENSAAEYLLRAERGMGLFLSAAESKGLYGPGAYHRGSRRVGQKPGRMNLPVVPREGVITNSDLGITHPAAALHYRSLATKWTNDEFEAQLEHVKSLGVRLAKIDFYRGPKREQARDAAVVREHLREDAEPAPPAIETFLEVSAVIIAGMSQLPDDALVLVATQVRLLAAAYNTARVARS
jgi:hypothetical protein